MIWFIFGTNVIALIACLIVIIATLTTNSDGYVTYPALGIASLALVFSTIVVTGLKSGTAPGKVAST